MTPADLEYLLAERPVSAEELAAAMPCLPCEVEGNVHSAVEAAHRADAPRLVRALEATLTEAHIRHTCECYKFGGSCFG